MRILEILIIIFLILLSIQFFLPSTIGKQKKGTVMGIVSVAGVVTFLLHILFEGMRWQIIPVYIPTLILFIWG
ncbi:MAG: acetylhydrolase, partial [Candidatus Thorarchaeota archaeon]|nr:acetylhydrolase [Candidatus Thorarchaeota archaeon]